MYSANIEILERVNLILSDKTAGFYLLTSRNKMLYPLVFSQFSHFKKIRRKTRLLREQFFD